MLCSIYKTRAKEGMYLYITQKDDFSRVPEPLMAKFTAPQLVMTLSLAKQQALAGVDKQALMDALDERGYYLQMPPAQENWLEEHRAELGLPPVAKRD